MKKYFHWFFIILSVLIFVLLFVFKDALNNYTSKVMQSQWGSEARSTVPELIDSAFNFSKKGLSYKVTFLEFGAKGCSACKRMESVMSEIRTKYPNQVNVVFINILLKSWQ